MFNKVYFSCLLIVLANMSSAFADTQLTSSYTSPKQTSPQTATILMKDGKLALQDQNGVINGFYDSSSDVVFAVDHNQKSYYEINRALATQVGKQLNSVMTTMNQQMEKAMAGMSDEQKRQFQSMMPGVMMQKPAPTSAQVSIRKTTKSNKVAGISCEVTEMIESKQSVQQLCIASYQAAGLSNQEMESLKKLGKFAGELAQLLNIGNLQQQLNPANFASAFDQMQGLPVSIDTNDGHSGRITAITHDAVSGALFSIPKGYQKKDVMSLLGGIGQ